jgi:hypothetical protein
MLRYPILRVLISLAPTDFYVCGVSCSKSMALDGCTHPRRVHTSTRLCGRTQNARRGHARTRLCAHTYACTRRVRARTPCARAHVRTPCARTHAARACAATCAPRRRHWMDARTHAVCTYARRVHARTPCARTQWPCARTHCSKSTGVSTQRVSDFTSVAMLPDFP